MTVKSPIIRPLGESIGFKERRFGFGIVPAIIIFNQSREFEPEILNFPKLWSSLMPTDSLTALTSRPVARNALERLKLGTSKGGSTSYSGGSNFAADGYSSNIKTHNVNATFDEIETVDIIIQLVNNQSDVELERLSREAQQQVDRSREDAITKLMVERNIIDGKIDELRRNFGIDPRASILSQDKLLL